jgi:uncharacterized membrane protein AbrB (regulator of aidB expression)
MKEFLKLFDPLIIVAFLTLFMIFVYSLIGALISRKTLLKALEKKEVDNNTFLELIREKSTGGTVFKKALAETPALLAFGLLILNGFLIMGRKEVPDFLSNAFFLAIGFYFGNKFVRKSESLDKR